MVRVESLRANDYIVRFLDIYLTIFRISVARLQVLIKLLNNTYLKQVLFWLALYCTVLYYFVSYCIVLYCIVLDMMQR